jgi:hypothetical protein
MDEEYDLSRLLRERIRFQTVILAFKVVSSAARLLLKKLAIGELHGCTRDDDHPFIQSCFQKPAGGNPDAS